MAGSDGAAAEIGSRIETLARDLLEICRKYQIKLTTAESCTGGLIAACLTDIPGSSAMLDRGFVTYSNEAKTELLGVPAALIAQHGAVSEPVARAMVKGALTRSRADIAVSVTGVAGPGGSDAKPEGLVHFAWANAEGDIRHERISFGPIGRDKVRAASVECAIEGLCDMGQRS
ncbi:MAG: CinA family protein [Pseudomonadota bacterium]